MEITFIGGAGSIGASCIYVECSGSSVVIDCGIRPGNSVSPLPDLSALNGKSPEAILVTHAHMDHTGALPVLVDYFSHVPVHATPPTIDLVSILLNDALKLMKNAENEGEIPLYTAVQVEKTLSRFIPVHHGDTRTIGPFSCTWYPAGHILGASMIHLATPEGNVLVTGDYSMTVMHTVGSLQRPALPVDLLVSEATYGDRLHEERSAAHHRFLGLIKEVLERGGRVLIPSFAIGRAQEIILLLRTWIRNGTLAKTPVYVDGMVRAVCAVYPGHERYVSRQVLHDIRTGKHPFFTDSIVAVDSPASRAGLLAGGPCIIVASSGMLSGGASVAYAREILKNERDAVLLTGYQDEESPGRALLDLAVRENEAKLFYLCGEPVTVAASVKLFGLSAHADRMQMSGFIQSLRPRTVVLVHGHPSAQESLKRSIECRDCICGVDGMTLRRSYPVRKSPRPAAEPLLPEENDIDRIRALLGPARESPLKAGEIADAWFGERVRPEVLERFVERLIALDLIRRDDGRRNLIWVLPPSHTGRFASEAQENALLKATNFKGKLLEHCMREKVDYPQVEWGIEGHSFTARIRVYIQGKQFDSGIHRASDRNAAEHLAAQCILEACEQDGLADLNGPVIAIDLSLSETLKARNPKGKLLELSNVQKSAPPHFESRVVAGSWCCRASWNTLRSCWYRSFSKTTAEQGAAGELIDRVKTQPAAPPAAPAADSGDTGQASVHSPHATENAAPPPPPNRNSGCHMEKDGRKTLNMLRQRGYVLDFGYEFTDATGPCHAPVFAVAAWATLDDTRRLAVEPQQAPSKKDAERKAANMLVELIGNMLQSGAGGADEP